MNDSPKEITEPKVPSTPDLTPESLNQIRDGEKQDARAESSSENQPHPKLSPYGKQAMQGNVDTPNTTKDATALSDAPSKEWKEFRENVNPQLFNEQLKDIDGPEDFKKIPYEQMVEGTTILRTEIMPRVANGATRDDFIALDQIRGKEGAMSYTNLYDVFYGDDAVRLDEHAPNQYKVTNGRHRLHVAKALEMESLPTRVTRQR